MLHHHACYRLVQVASFYHKRASSSLNGCRVPCMGAGENEAGGLTLPRLASANFSTARALPIVMICR